MATQQSTLREPSKPASAVSLPHLFGCRDDFTRNVLPNFPAAKAFAPHFDDSYALMRILSKESAVPAGLGLLLLGVKSHEILPASFTGPLMRNLNRFTRLDLSFRTTSSGAVELFHPASIEQQLKSVVGGGLPYTTRADLWRFAALNAENPASYPYELLGWPSLVSPSDTFFIYTMKTERGALRFPSKQDELNKTRTSVYRAVAAVEHVLEKSDAFFTRVFYSENPSPIASAAGASSPLPVSIQEALVFFQHGWRD
jgi:hypothetical protein